MTEDVLKKLENKATILTQERKQRGRTVPEELVTPEDLRSFRTLASHPVSRVKSKFLLFIISLSNIHHLMFCIMKVYYSINWYNNLLKNWVKIINLYCLTSFSMVGYGFLKLVLILSEH